MIENSDELSGCADRGAPGQPEAEATAALAKAHRSLDKAAGLLAKREARFAIMHACFSSATTVMMLGIFILQTVSVSVGRGSAWVGEAALLLGAGFAARAVYYLWKAITISLGPLWSGRP